MFTKPLPISHFRGGGGGGGGGGVGGVIPSIASLAKVSNVRFAPAIIAPVVNPNVKVG